MPSAINFQSVSFRYFAEASDTLQNFSAVIPPGQISVLTGPSGCGKSTLLFLAAGLYPEHGGQRTGGQVLLGDTPVEALDPLERSRRMGLLFQNADLQFCFERVDREMRFVMENACMDPEKMDDAMQEALAFVGLSGYEKRLIRTLSGGEKQRLNLAIRLAVPCEWLLLDEIFSQVDPKQRDAILPLLVKLRDRGVSILAVDHQLAPWQGIADAIYLLDQSGQLASGPEECRTFTADDWANRGVLAKGVRYPGPEKRTQPGEKLLSVSDLSVTRGGKKILQNIAFRLERGKLYALLGASGIGKSSLLEALAGFHKNSGVFEGPLAPTPRFFGRKQQVSPAIRLLFQSPQDQFVKNTVSEELLFSLQRKFADPQQQEASCRALLQAAQLWRFRRYAPFQLSEGQQRRLAVMALLAEGAQLLLCDEPCYAQDYCNTLAIMDELVRAAREENTSILFSSHDWALAKSYADVIFYLKEDGLYEITADELPAEL